MRRLVGVAALVALALAPAASAHVTVLPTFLEQGKQAKLVFTAPNERAPHSVIDLTVTFPRGVELSAVSPPSGWQVTVVPANGRWTGGKTSPGTTTEYPIDARTDLPPGAVTVYAVQRYDDGKSVRWAIPFTIAPASNSPSEHLWSAVIVAIVGFVAIVGGLVLVRRRKPKVGTT
jgi:uncharacterized protein YcnI